MRTVNTHSIAGRGKLRFPRGVMLALLFAFQLASHLRAASVSFEAESGVLGSDWTVNNSASPAFVTIQSNNNANNPGTANRVATYTVTFPGAGTYALYVRLRVGPNGANDDSLFYGNGFGMKSPTTDNNWMTVNGLAAGGFTAPTDAVMGNGSAGTQVWKWVNLSQFNPGGSGTEAPITFAVPAGNLTQTFQIGAREDGLDLDKFVFGTAGDTFTVSDLDNGTPPSPPVCEVTWDDTQQRIDGFGFSSAWCVALSSVKNAALYGTLGMSLLRIRIDDQNNWGNETANAAVAHAYGAKVLGCAWTAPAYMMVTNSGILRLSTNYYAAYALWLNQAANAHNLDYVSIKNEPDGSGTVGWFVWDPDEMRKFCASNAPSIGRPITMADAIGFNDAVSDPTLNDPVAASNIAIVSGHFYGNGNRVHTNALAKGKPVWMTEHYLDGGTTNFPVCLNFAKEINDAMKNQFSAYIAWWAHDGDTNINLAHHNGTIFKDGYTLGQFAKFIRPGYYRMGTTSTGGGAQITAYQDLTTGNYVIVALNLSSQVITQQFNLSGFPAMSANLSVTPWITSYTQSLAAQSPITNVGSSFSYSIQPSNIVTFVATPPVAVPAGLTAQGGDNKVDLTWNAVAGATSYNVKRATGSGGPYVTVAEVAATNCSDGGLLAQTTYFYVVSATKNGSQSGDSLEASATTSLIHRMEPVADAYVNDGSSAGINLGAAANLTVKNDGGSSTGYNRITYLKFDVHALTNVQNVKLILMPSQVDGVAGLVYQVWSNDNWTETGITWNNQPAGTGLAIANISNYTLWTAVAIDVTGVVSGEATNDGILTIRVTQPAANSTRIDFCSREYATAGYRPMLQYVIYTNTPPVLAAISDRTVGVGGTLNITNAATDSDLPAQTLTFSLPTAPTNASINPNSGVLTWRPLVTHANSTNPFTVIVADNGTPSLSATRSFSVTVPPLAQPALSIPSLSSGQLVLQVNGASGPDYQIQASSNLVDWTAVFTTNAPPVPFFWTSDMTNGPVNFFRIQVGPPLP